MDKLFSDENRFMTIGVIAVLLLVVIVVVWFLMKSPAKQQAIPDEIQYAEPVGGYEEEEDEPQQELEPGAFENNGPGAEF